MRTISFMPLCNDSLNSLEMSTTSLDAFTYITIIVIIMIKTAETTNELILCEVSLHTNYSQVTPIRRGSAETTHHSREN